MESYISSAWEVISSADMVIVAVIAALVALMPIVKWTKNKVDDKYFKLAIDGLNKAKDLLGKFKPKAK